MSNPAVEMVQVSKTFPGHTPGEKAVDVLQEISLTIEDGEFYTLLGPSGCGKTTTLRLIAGFEQPSSGDIFVKGKRMNHLPPYHRPVNTVFQKYALFPHLNVAENIAFGLVNRGIPRAEQEKQVADMLAMVQLTGVERRKPAQLSGGQQQRVALVRALINHPEVLLLDEPLNSLDLKLRKQMQLELKHIQTKTGITFIYVTHDQEEALTMSDRIAVMDRGKVLQVDTPRAIYEKPTSRFVAAFIGESNFLNGQVLDVRQGSAAIRLWGGQTIEMRVNGVPLRNGQQATLVARPEKLHLADPRSDLAASEVHFPGTISEAVYAGDTTQYLVELFDGESLKIRASNAGSQFSNERRPGDAVEVCCSAQDLRVVESA